MKFKNANFLIRKKVMKMKKKMHKNLNKKRLFLSLLLLCVILYLYLNSHNTSVKNTNLISSLENHSEYDIIKQDTNRHYSGIGQEKVKHKDGYFTTFTTEENHKKTYLEYKQNGDASWSNNTYWGDTMAENGCGITVLSIILSGYRQNYTPEDLRKKYYPVMDYEQFSSELSSTFGIKNSGFYYDSEHLSNTAIEEHLLTNRPIIICVWNTPHNNRWTTASHYMALLATDGNGMVYVSNPNGLENDSKSSGWYDINEITPYLAKAIYIEDYE